MENNATALLGRLTHVKRDNGDWHWRDFLGFKGNNHITLHDDNGFTQTTMPIEGLSHSGSDTLSNPVLLGDYCLLTTSVRHPGPIEVPRSDWASGGYDV